MWDPGTEIVSGADTGSKRADMESAPTGLRCMWGLSLYTLIHPTVGADSISALFRIQNPSPIFSCTPNQFLRNQNPFCPVLECDIHGGCGIRRQKLNPGAGAGSMRADMESAPTGLRCMWGFSLYPLIYPTVGADSISALFRIQKPSPTFSCTPNQFLRNQNPFCPVLECEIHGGCGIRRQKLNPGAGAGSMRADMESAPTGLRCMWGFSLYPLIYPTVGADSISALFRVQNPSPPFPCTPNPFLRNQNPFLPCFGM
jgi:hypothetical protein